MIRIWEKNTSKNKVFCFHKLLLQIQITLTIEESAGVENNEKEKWLINIHIVIIAKEMITQKQPGLSDGDETKAAACSWPFRRVIAYIYMKGKLKHGNLFPVLSLLI